MTRKILTSLLALSLLLPEALWAQSEPQQVASAKPAAQATATSNTGTPAQTEPSQTTRPQPPARRASYERESHPHRRSSISKKEVVFLAAIAGTSMGIGALAAGGTGVAIGAIVGGWGAYAGHRLWKWVH